VLGVVVLGIAIYALRHPSGGKTAAGTPTRSTSRTPSRSAPATHRASSTPAPSSASEGKLPLVVLNNSTIQGLAEQARSTFIAGGWQVTSVGNLRNDIISTCAYYDPTVSGAQQAAEALMGQFPAIKRTAPKFDGLPPGPIVVVLTSDYASG
jgi:LytR cell envelope-related transcriptional attenuator